MKIVKTAAEARKEASAWWIGRHHTCPSCACEVILEDGDDISSYGLKDSIAYRCPDCKRYVIVRRPIGFRNPVERR